MNEKKDELQITITLETAEALLLVRNFGSLFNQIYPRETAVRIQNALREVHAAISVEKSMPVISENMIVQQIEQLKQEDKGYTKWTEEELYELRKTAIRILTEDI